VARTAARARTLFARLSGFGERRRQRVCSLAALVVSQSKGDVFAIVFESVSFVAGLLRPLALAFRSALLFRLKVQERPYDRARRPVAVKEHAYVFLQRRRHVRFNAVGPVLLSFELGPSESPRFPVASSLSRFRVASPVAFGPFLGASSAVVNSSPPIGVRVAQELLGCVSVWVARETCAAFDVAALAPLPAAVARVVWSMAAPMNERRRARGSAGRSRAIAAASQT
ncbi:MAG: hypothetical protein BJ554DRAFT_3402, partial [Olpidium bornovanus]